MVGPLGTPLWLATLASRADVVKYALLHGAPVASPGPNGDTALRVAERTTTDALVAALFSGANFWANASTKEAQTEVDAADGQAVHDSVCDRSGVQIVGCLYHLRGYNYDICEEEYAKLSKSDKEKYEAVPKPPRRLFEGELQQLCKSQDREDLCSLLALVDQSEWVRARQRCGKRLIVRHFILKAIISPRQARDKHRENSKRDPLSAGWPGLR